MRSFSLLADGGKPTSSPLANPDLIYGTVGLVGALLVGAAVVYTVDRWRKRSALRDQGQDGAELTSFRAMFERGEITEAEYAVLRQKVASRVKAPPANAAPPAAGPRPPAVADHDPGAAGPTPPPA